MKELDEYEAIKKKLPIDQRREFTKLVVTQEMKSDAFTQALHALAEVEDDDSDSSLVIDSDDE